MGGRFAKTFRVHALWGILLPFYPGSLLTLTRDLVELLEVSLLVGSLLLLRRNKQVAATVILVLAVLAKETALLVAVGAALVCIVARLRKKAAPVRWYYFTAPLAVFIVWQLLLFKNWGEIPVLAGSVNIGTPLSGFLSFFRHTLAYQTPLQRRALPELLFLIVFALSVLYCLRNALASAHEAWSWLLYLILLVFLSKAIWVEDWTF